MYVGCFLLTVRSPRGTHHTTPHTHTHRNPKTWINRHKTRQIRACTYIQIQNSTSIEKPKDTHQHFLNQSQNTKTNTFVYTQNTHVFIEMDARIEAQRHNHTIVHSYKWSQRYTLLRGQY